MPVRTTDDLEKKLKSQLLFLERSAKAFDGGMEDEDVRIAHALRVIFHNTNHSHSIVHQLGRKVNLVDTSCALVQNNLVGEMPLVATGIGGKSGTRFFAPLNEIPRKN
jgi:hypothetical protein